jgi:outer membrane protein OmpA-like peptidoglycan-associated protein
MRFLYYCTKPINLTAFLIILLSLSNISTTWANGNNFYDYLPKYRKYKSHYQIDKIQYQEKRTIIYFRFVAQSDEKHTFYGSDHPDAWYLRTPKRMRGVEIQFKQLELKDLRVNNETKLESLNKVPDISYEIARGDVVTFQVHFVRIPQYLRMLDMIEGKGGATNPDKFNCFDILIKTKENPLLGSAANENQVIARFEKSFNYIKPRIADKPTATTVAMTENKPKPSSINPDRKTAPAEKEESVMTTSPVPEEDIPAPIDYMPTSLNVLEDLKCSQRVVMPNVAFKENETTFSGRIKAIQNIRLIAEYLKYYPDADLNIYGHTDIFGSKYKNRNLSRERAFAVKRELVKMGINSDRIKVYFFGGERPLKKYKNGGPDNRRVEVQPVCTEG